MTDNIAESAFVGVVAEALKSQNAILELREQLQELDVRAERANAAALNELGFNEATPPEDVLDAQERFLNAAIERSGLPDDSPVVRATRAQIRAVRTQVAQAIMDEAAAFDRMGGPQL